MTLLTASVPTVSYRGEPALLASHFEFGSGRHVILGPNGAGKTTLLSLLAAQFKRATAQLHLIQQDLTAAENGYAFQGHVGFLPQDPGYPRHMKVQAFVEYAAWLKQISTNRLQTYVEDALSSTNTLQVAGKRLGQLSGGTLRRVGLAAATVHRPTILILDEPTAGLDPIERQQFYTVMRSRDATATIISTHLFEDAIAVEGQIHIMARGEYKWSGSLSDLCPDGVTVESLGSAFAQIVG